MSEYCSLVEELGFDRDVHIVGYKDTAGFEGCVPAQAVVFAVNLRGGGETDARIAR